MMLVCVGGLADGYRVEWDPKRDRMEVAEKDPGPLMPMPLYIDATQSVKHSQVYKKVEVIYSTGPVLVCACPETWEPGQALRRMAQRYPR